ncbi:Mbov_0400 family ICE element protein [Candidatus Mycoplasma pogonae]
METKNKKRIIDNFKPQMTKKISEQPLVFSRFLLPLDDHPIIVFYSEGDECYYYVKGRSVHNYYEDPNTGKKIKGKMREPFKGEMIIKPNNKAGLLFKRDTYVDTTQLFRIHEDDLWKITDHSKISKLEELKLPLEDSLKILNEIQNNADQVPPLINLIQVKVNNNGNVLKQIIYGNKELLDYEFDISFDYIKSKLSNEKIASIMETYENQNKINEKEIKRSISNTINSVKLELLHEAGYRSSITADEFREKMKSKSNQQEKEIEKDRLEEDLELGM